MNKTKSKQMKLIAGASVAVLAVGYCGLYQWSKNAFLQAYTEQLEQLRKDGYDVESTPLAFSGFPFSLTAHQEKVKVSKTLGERGFSFSGMGIDTTVSVFNPLKSTTTGNMTFAIVSKNTPFASASFEKIDGTLGKIDGKYTLEKVGFHHVKVELLTPEKVPGLNMAIKFIGFKQAEHKTGTESDIPVLTDKREYTVEDITLTGYAHGTTNPLGHFKEITLTSKSKAPTEIAKQIVEFMQQGSPFAQICHAGGRVPALKEAVSALEKVGSHYEMDIKMDHDAYKAKLNFEGHLESSKPVLSLEVELDKIDKVLDAFDVPAAARLIANSLFVSEPGKTNQGKVSIQVKNGAVTMNGKEMFKLPDFDWDNITLPAAMCEPLNKAANAVSSLA